MPSLIPSIKRIVEEGVPFAGSQIRCTSYEGNVPFVLRFMIDNEIYGANWIELPAKSFRRKESTNFASRCSIEVEVFYNCIISHAPHSEWSYISPIRILSFDIECAGRKGHFPDAQYDPVIQIANTVSAHGSDKNISQVVFTLNTCLPIVGAHVVSSSTEAEMLLNWRNFVNNADPDIITGYNIANFDIPYLITRAKV
jgi:DNA polymerase delta subunit 1